LRIGAKQLILVTGGAGISFVLYEKFFSLLTGRLEIWPLVSSEGARVVDEGGSPDSQEEIVRPEAFQHPFHKLPWYKQFFLTAQRVLFLAFLFSPFSALSAVAYITNSDRLREYSIRLLVKTFENAGCSFLKFGQWMSMRPDMIPPDVVEALKTLCDGAPEHDFRHTRRIIQNSFGREIEDIFESFDEHAVASGSVAQVHRARLKPEYGLADGSVDVAVKVRHPSVERETFVDLDILYTFCDTLAKVSRVFTVPFDRDEFRTRVQTQIDFKWEAYNLRRFAQNFKEEVKSDHFIFPSLSNKLLSSSTLVESWAPGNVMTNLFSKVGDGFVEVVGDIKNLKKEFGQKMREKKEILAKDLFDMQMKMILRDNHAHGDLHGGNVMYSPNTNTITVLDAGMATSLDPEVVEGFSKFLVTMAEGDAKGMTARLLSFVDKKISPAYSNTSEDPPEFLTSVQSEVDKWIAPDTGKAPGGGPISIGDLMGGILFKMNHHGLCLRGDVAGQMISFSITEGLIRQLDPPFDVVNSAKPYLLQYGAGSRIGASNVVFESTFESLKERLYSLLLPWRPNLSVGM
jgi:aarF domain-containing kinase